MKFLTERKFALLIIAVSLFFLLHTKTANWNDEIVENNYSENTPAAAGVSPLQFNEQVIYTCRLANEEIPAVQISEVKDQNGRVIETVARAAVGSGIETAVQGVGASWDYKSIAARAGDKVIDVAYQPGGGRADYDWILSVSDNGGFFRQRVRDCMEVSDE